MHRTAALPIAAALLMGLTGCVAAGAVGDTVANAGATRPEPHVITIDGAGTALVSLDQDGAGSQETDVPLPHHITIDPDVRAVSVSAQLSGQDAGSGISCSITDLDNNVLKEASSSGDYAVVSCSVALR